MDAKGIVVAVVGADGRQRAAARALAAAGCRVGGGELAGQAGCLLLPLPVDAAWPGLAGLLAAARACKAREEALRSARGRLDALSPKGVLARGYAYVTRAGRPARRLAIGDRITLHLAAGQAQAEVKDWRDAHACEEKGKADV